MIGSTRNVNVGAYPKPSDLRKGHHGLSGLVVTEFEADLLSGDFFIFLNRRRTFCKLLLWDGTLHLQKTPGKGSLSQELDNIRKQKQGQLQQELMGIKQHLAKLEKMQFGALSEKRKRDEI